MSIIQKIRDKYSRIAVVAIALALLGFILIDYISGRGRGPVGGGPNNIGSINGKKIDILDFEKKVQQQEDYLKQQSQPTEGIREQAINATWDQEINRILLNEEADKLGIKIGKKELNDMLFGSNPHAYAKQYLGDPNTGQYDPARTQQIISQIRKSKDQAQKDQLNTLLNAIEEARNSEKYIAMMTNSANFPRWYLEKQNADKSLLAKISMVRDVYSIIPDSSIKISDGDIADYINKHKDDYKQEESRSIGYVSFNAAPSVSDSAEAKNKIESLRIEFDTTGDVKKLLEREGPFVPYNDRFFTEKEIPSGKDSIIKKPAGSIYGPYIEGTNYVLAKLVAVRQIPDTVKVRHILIATGQRNPQTGQIEQTRDSTEAKKKIDSIQRAIKNGSNFDTLLKKFSEDPGSKEKGGVYDSVGWGRMVPEFNDFIFLKKTGENGVVKTEFGYHYIEILSQRGNISAYKIAYLPAQIVTSRATDDSVRNRANGFAGDSRNQKLFDEHFEKDLKPRGLVKGIATGITPMAFEIRGLGTSRNFIKDIYKAKQGEVIQSTEMIADNYVVAVVTEINKEETQSVAKARASIEKILQKKKKAEQLIQKTGKVTTLEAAATTLGKQIEVVDSLRMSTSSASSKILGYEPRVYGAAFNPANKGKVVQEALEGINGVYVIRIDNVTATAVENANVEELRKTYYNQAKQNASYAQSPAHPTNIVKKAATIKDKRRDQY